MTDVGDASQRRVVELMVHYAAEVQCAAANCLLTNVSAWYGQPDPPPLEQMVKYSTKELGVWSRRPGMPHDPVTDLQDDKVQWLK